MYTGIFLFFCVKFRYFVFFSEIDCAVAIQSVSKIVKNWPFWATLVPLSLGAQRSWGAETLQIARSILQLGGKIIPVQNEFRGSENESKNRRKTPHWSDPSRGQKSPRGRITLQAREGSRLILGELGPARSGSPEKLES